MSAIRVVEASGSSGAVQLYKDGSFHGDSRFSFDVDNRKLFVTGSTYASTGFSGSLTRLTDGKSYLVAGAGISIVSSSNSQITITNTTSGEGAGDITKVTAGTGLGGGGSSGDVTLNIDDSTVATLTGSVFSGNVVMKSDLTVSGTFHAYEVKSILVSSSIIFRSGSTKFGNTSDDLHQFTGSVSFKNGLSGSLTRLQGGTSYLAAGSNITIASASNGQITISATDSTTAAGSDTYVQFNDGGSFGGDSGLTFNKSTNTLTANNISGSLTRLSGGTSYLSAGSNITIASASSGQVTLSSATRAKKKFNITSALSAGSNYTVSSINFSNANHDSDYIDVFVNGQLLSSGTVAEVSSNSVDYSLTGNTTLKFNFDLENDDVLTVVCWTI